MKKNIIKISTIAMVGALALTSVSFAEEQKTRPVKEARQQEVKPLRQEMRTEIKDDRMEFREERKMEVKDARGQIQENRTEFKAKIEDLKGNGVKGDIKIEARKMMEENKNIRQLSREEVEKKRSELKTEVKTRIAEFKEGKKVILDEAKKEKVKQTIEKVFARLSGAIERLKAFDTRISVAISARKAKGLDTSKAESAIEEARDALETAKVAVEETKSASTESVDDSQGVSNEALRSAIEEAHSALKIAKEKYIEVIKSLPIPKRPEGTSSSTPETTN
jgi:predicted RNase H-like HicB family nuclease